MDGRKRELIMASKFVKIRVSNPKSDMPRGISFRDISVMCYPKGCKGDSHVVEFPIDGIAVILKAGLKVDVIQDEKAAPAEKKPVEKTVEVKEEVVIAKEEVLPVRDSGTEEVEDEATDGEEGEEGDEEIDTYVDPLAPLVALTKAQLTILCKKHKFSTFGNKADLADRLAEDKTPEEIKEIAAEIGE